MADILYEDALDVLDSYEEKNGWLMCICPAHADNEPSLGIRKYNDGTLNANCLASCSKEDVYDAIGGLIGRSGGTPAPKKKKKKTKGASKSATITNTYIYNDVNGFPVAVKHRYEPKDFRWADPEDPDKLGLPKGMREEELPLYHIDKVVELNREFVFFVEGEKAADKLSEAYGYTAVCLPGGAKGKINLDTLEPLRGRKIVLWGDNDSAGRALMERLFDALVGLAADIRAIAPYVKEGGDPADYVAAGYSREELRNEIKNAPVGETLTETADGFEVRIPYAGEIVVFEFEDVEHSARAMETAVNIYLARRPKQNYPCRQNLLSESAKKNLVSQLLIFFGESDKAGWTKLITRAWSRVIDHVKTKNVSIPVMDPLPEGSKNLYLIKPLVANDGLTIHFGMGGSGKSYLSALIALLTAAPYPHKLEEIWATERGTVLYLDYEASRAKLNFRINGLIKGLGWDIDVKDLPIRYLECGGVPLKRMLSAVRKEVSEHDVRLMIIDSVGQATGADLLSQETVSTFANAVARCGVRSCVALAHVTKDEGVMYPFGSIYWSNSPRLTWFITRYNPTSESMGVAALNRKANDDGPQHPLGVQLDFEGELGSEGFVVYARGDEVPENVAQLSNGNGNGRDSRPSSQKDWEDECLRVLEKKDLSQPWTVDELISWTGLSKRRIFAAKKYAINNEEIKKGTGTGRADYFTLKR